MSVRQSWGWRPRTTSLEEDKHAVYKNNEIGRESQISDYRTLQMAVSLRNGEISVDQGSKDECG